MDARAFLESIFVKPDVMTMHRIDHLSINVATVSPEVETILYLFYTSGEVERVDMKQSGILGFVLREPAEVAVLVSTHTSGFTYVEVYQ